MQQNSPPSFPILNPAHLPEIPELSSDAPEIPAGDPTASSLFDWSDFLDFSIDESLNVSFTKPETHHPDQSGVDESQHPDSSVRVRKRDPKLVCPNFLAGRIPCACPELDEKLEEEESALPGKKRARGARGSGGGLARCQVPGCEVDISELKGYHKRHRVCLRCANATVVVLDGESKRYCQQCGKFHILSDFDEGKRSCRRKLERHNNRRRRKLPYGSLGGIERNSQQITSAGDVSCEDDAGKDDICVSSQVEEREVMLESDGHVSILSSALGSRNLQSDCVVSVTASDEIHIDGEKQSRQFKLSPSYENKSTYSSVFPTGRISFKLYDWNPAEFPRRLRHQIFQWLASMPVELEGYIRPGCTILTAFVAMPKPMWLKLLGEPALHIKDLVASPGSMLSGRGRMHVYLNHMMFWVTKDSTSVVKVMLKDQAPKLHYIYPTWFEAGQPMEFVACGSDLLQPKFRFLISFGGRYLAYKISVSSMCCKKEEADSFNHQLLNIYVPQTDVDLSGPMFLEVENESGLSNFIPILVGDKETCAEMEILQQKFEAPFSPEEQQLSLPRPACEVFSSRQEQFSEFILDVAWLLKKPGSEQQLTSSHVQRFNHLLEFLIENESLVILERVLCSLKSAIDKNLVTVVPDTDMKLLRKNMDTAQSRVDRKLLAKDLSVVTGSNGSFCNHRSRHDNHAVEPNQDMQRTVKKVLGFRNSPPCLYEGATVPLLKGEVVMTVDCQERPQKSRRPLLTRTLFTSSRPLIIVMAAVGVCFGLCAVILHPQRVGQIATTLRRCLFNNSS